MTKLKINLPKLQKVNDPELDLFLDIIYLPDTDDVLFFEPEKLATKQSKNKALVSKLSKIFTNRDLPMPPPNLNEIIKASIEPTSFNIVEKPKEEEALDDLDLLNPNLNDKNN